MEFDLHLQLQRGGSGWTGLESITFINVQGYDLAIGCMAAMRGDL